MINSVGNLKHNNFVCFTNSGVRIKCEEGSFLSKLDAMGPDRAYDYLISVTSDKVKSKAFIEEITKNPRDSRKNVARIYKALGSKEKFDEWYFSKNGYMQAFHDYIEEFYRNATSIEELFHFMPSWGNWMISRKVAELKGLFIFPEPHYTVGKLPDDFQDEETFKELVEKVMDPASIYGVKNHQDNVVVKGKCFKVEYPKQGASGKFVAIINDKYVIKKAYRMPKCNGDSPYLNMAVDYYLTSNGCKNSSKFLYYDEESETVIYERAEIKPLKYKVFGKEQYYSPLTLFNQFDDAKQLGIIYTDTAPSNYTMHNGNEIAIDSGHCEFMDILRPGIADYHITLPSNTGFSQMGYYGILSDIAEKGK